MSGLQNRHSREQGEDVGGFGSTIISTRLGPDPRALLLGGNLW